MVVTKTFTQFFESEKAGGLLLVLCTIVSLVAANSPLAAAYARLWQTSFAGLTLHHWINDALMAVFFLLVGLELERELYSGELSNLRNALLPIIGAIGGVYLPAQIHFTLNAATPSQAGAAIPMATDIAFALGALALLGSRIPLALKVFLTALAVMDDLAAIVVIALFYTDKLALSYLATALSLFALLFVLNVRFRVMALAPYLVGGAAMWFLMHASGVHATIAGVLLAFAIPYSARMDDEASPSHRLEHALHKPVAFLILPLFALANTAIEIGAGWQAYVLSTNGLGIIAGLAIGKPLGITLASYVAVRLGLCALPAGLTWRHIFGASLLGGIGFTMSIFIANLAFSANSELINGSIVAVLLGSLASGLLGYAWLRVALRQAP